MSASWTWFLTDAHGSALCELTTASGRSIAYKRNTYAEAACTISHEDEDASLLLSALARGIPQLHGYRRGPRDVSAIRRFKGYLAPFQEDVEEAATLSLVFRSPLGRFVGDGNDRGRFTDANLTAAQQDAGQIGAELVRLYGGILPAGNAGTVFTGALATGYDAGLAIGTVEATKLRDRTYQFANVGDALVNLTNVLDGFDMFEDFTPEPPELNIVASQGQVRDAARFEYGADTLNNVRSVTRTTQPPINVARVLGANGLSSIRTDSRSIAKYGVWMTQASVSDVSEQATLDDKAQALLRPNPVKTLTFVPDLGLENCPKPWDDFWLGDTVQCFARRAALAENVAARVNGITVTIDDDGFETAEVPDDALPGDVDPLHANETDQFTTQPSVDTEVVDS